MPPGLSKSGTELFHLRVSTPRSRLSRERGQIALLVAGRQVECVMVVGPARSADQGVKARGHFLNIEPVPSLHHRLGRDVMKLTLRMLLPLIGIGIAFAAAPAEARNYDCSKAGNANKTACKNAAPAPAPARSAKSPAERHYDCSKAGNATKAACRSVAPVPAPAAPSTAKMPAERHYDCSKAGNANKMACKGASASPAPPVTPVTKAAAPAPRAAPIAPRSAAAAGPSGATAKCKDGSYSHSQTRSGTCSHHRWSRDLVLTISYYWETSMKKMIIALTAVTEVAAPTLAGTITCRRPNGQIAKKSECPPSGKAVAAAGGQISAPDAKGKCHVVVPAPGSKQKKGQFASCPKG